MKFISEIKRVLSDNSADLHMERMVTIAIAFVAGGRLIAAIWLALKEHYAPGVNANIHDYLG